LKKFGWNWPSSFVQAERSPTTDASSELVLDSWERGRPETEAFIAKFMAVYKRWLVSLFG
jgi:hypothetical protein